MRVQNFGLAGKYSQSNDHKLTFRENDMGIIGLNDTAVPPILCRKVMKGNKWSEQTSISITQFETILLLCIEFPMKRFEVDSLMLPYYSPPRGKTGP